MELIINGMLKLGAGRHCIRAKVFGGSSLLSGEERASKFSCVGEVNCRFILEFLEKDGIPLMSSDLGGNRGRLIRFDARDYSVYVRKLEPLGPKIVHRERLYWKNTLKKHEQEIPVAEIWE
jgi:chemotaxis protein CheD